MNTTSENIKEIAEQLDCGFRAFVHKTQGQLLFVPDDNSYIDIDDSPWSEELELLESNFFDYTEIEKWTSREAFEMRVAFAEFLTDLKLKTRLLNALHKKKPFREFSFVIDNAGDYREEWFKFKNNWQIEFVKRQLEQENPDDI